MKYLGIPIDKKRIHNVDQIPTENKIEKNLGCWLENFWLLVGD